MARRQWLRAACHRDSDLDNVLPGEGEVSSTNAVVLANPYTSRVRPTVSDHVKALVQFFRYLGPDVVADVIRSFGGGVALEGDDCTYAAHRLQSFRTPRQDYCCQTSGEEFCLLVVVLALTQVDVEHDPVSSDWWQDLSRHEWALGLACICNCVFLRGFISRHGEASLLRQLLVPREFE